MLDLVDRHAVRTFDQFGGRADRQQLEREAAKRRDRGVLELRIARPLAGDASGQRRIDRQDSASFTDSCPRTSDEYPWSGRRAHGSDEGGCVERVQHVGRSQPAAAGHHHTEASRTEPAGRVGVA